MSIPDLEKLMEEVRERETKTKLDNMRRDAKSIAQKLRRFINSVDADWIDDVVPSTPQTITSEEKAESAVKFLLALDEVQVSLKDYDHREDLLVYYIAVKLGWL